MNPIGPFVRLAAGVVELVESTTPDPETRRARISASTKLALARLAARQERWRARFAARQERWRGRQ